MDDAERTHTLVEDYWDRLLELDPLLGTFSGDIEVHRRHGKCGAASDQALLPTYVAASTR